jgi:exonuclease SbcC
MRLRRLAFRGLTRFTGEPVRIDLDDLGPGLIALVGANGQGKTTALEAVAAALYKRLPTRPGSLYDHCHGRDAFIEAEFVDGGSPPDFLKVRVQVDVDRKLTEGYVFVNGAPVTTGRAAEFTQAIERWFGSEDLFLASAFAAQDKGGSFLTMDRRTRKELFAQLLGLDRLGVLHVRAKARRADLEKDLMLARHTFTTSEAELAEAGGLDRVTGQVEEANKIAGRAAEDLKERRHEESRAGADLERSRSYEQRLGAILEASTNAGRAYALADKAFKDAEGLKALAETSAATRRRALNEREKPADMEARARKRHEEAANLLEQRLLRQQEVRRQEPEITAARQELADLGVEEEHLRARLQDIVKLTTEKDRAEAALSAAERRFEDSTNASIREVEGLRRRAALMEQAPCTASERWAFNRSASPQDLAGTCPLLKDARDAKLSIPGVKVDPAVIEEKEKASERFETLVGRVFPLQAEVDAAQARLKEIALRRPYLQTTAAQASLIEEAVRQINEIAEEADRIRLTLQADLRNAAEEQGYLHAEFARIEQDLTEAVFDALESVGAAKKALDEARLTRLRAEEKLAEIREERIPGVAEALLAAERGRARREDQEKILRTSDARVAELAALLARLVRVNAEMETVRGRVVQLETEVGDWKVLERALGPEGVQALEIDAAGPEVAALTNDLLSTFPGRRFSITLETLREKKSAAGEFIEVFDVKVYDGGHERPIEALSGGERVVVGEALGLAIAIFNARKSGIQWRTLFRDETAGALDPENAQAYVEMLRRALELGGFEQVLFVSHSFDVWQRADARLHVQDGRIVPERQTV